jgi:gliding motility-associated-like protein
MNKSTFISILLTALIFGAFAHNNLFGQSENISGIVNTYTNVTNIAGLNISVGSSTGFVACDRVLIIQMKGATIDVTNTAFFGQITAYNNAGNYEFANVASVAGNVINLTAPLTQTYTTTGAVQLIRVPVYSNPTITGNLTCPNWNGATGGVLVFESTGPVIFNANIDVSGRGFVGGAMVTGGFSCTNSNYATNLHGKKGEGIAAAPAGQDSHRAPLANGGGGSSPGNCGAAGGGNFGAGGRGGDEYSGCGFNFIFGLGGYALATLPAKAFLGGGGGGGFRDNGQPCADGANGGGIVMINAPSIAGNGFSILANGGSVTLLTRDEGAGAGGAGGSVYLRVPSITSALNVNVRGGAGGNIQNTIFASDAHGPGGGGGGGYVWVTSAAIPSNLNVTSAGGNAGLIQHAGFWFNTTYSAANGANGTTLFNLNNIIPVPSTHNFPSPDLGPDTLFCGAGTTALQLDTVYNSYLWSDGSTNAVLNAGVSGLYWVEVPVGCALFDRDSINVIISNPTINLGTDQNLCQGDSILFDAGAGFVSYAWNSGSVNSSLQVNAVGTYSVTVTDAAGCTATDMAAVLNVYPLPSINLGPDIAQCGNASLLNAGTGFTNYLWQDGSGADTFNVTSTGTYWVGVTDVNNCVNADTINVIINPLPVFDLGVDVYVCHGEEVVISPNGPAVAVNYLWSDGSTNSTLVLNISGTYYLTVTDSNSCNYSDSINVLLDCLYIPNAFSPNGDNLNDLFEVLNLDKELLTNFKIYNRWGQLVYDNAEEAAWNGKYKGVELPRDVYIYVIEWQILSSQPVTVRRGLVTLMR